MLYHSRHIYDAYRQDGGTVPYTKFRKVLEDFNEEVGTRMLEGYSFPLGANLNRLHIVRVIRDFRHKMMINWPESFKLKKEIIARGETPRSKEHPEGREWLVYRTDEEYCAFYWAKNHSRSKVTNTIFYAFKPVQGARGVKARLIRLLKEDSLAYLRFPINR